MASSSLDRIRANQRNAQKSTGPRTAEGKARSRCNAFKHGLTGAGIGQPEAEAAELERRTAEWSRSLAPRDEREAWVVRQVVLASMRLDRCFGMELGQRRQFQDRAAVCWNDDRERDIADLAAKLERDPHRTRQHLRGSKQGCAWLIARWEALLRALDGRGGWTSAEHSLALDLLGIPPLEREFHDVLPPGAPAAQLRAVAEREVAGLARRLDELDDLNDTDQALAAEGVGFDVSPPARLLRRYEAASRTMLFWGLSQLTRAHRLRPGPAALQSQDEPGSGFDEDEEDEGLESTHGLADGRSGRGVPAVVAAPSGPGSTEGAGRTLVCGAGMGPGAAAVASAVPTGAAQVAPAPGAVPESVPGGPRPGAGIVEAPAPVAPAPVAAAASATRASGPGAAAAPGARPASGASSVAPPFRPVSFTSALQAARPLSRRERRAMKRR